MAKSSLAVKRKSTLQAYKPSLREQAAILGEKGFKVITGREPGYEARENINRYTGLLDMLELPGMALSADDARRNLKSKQYGAAAGDLAGLAVGAIPIAGGALKGGAKKAVREGVEGAADLVKRYGAEHVPEIADRVAAQLRELGSDIKVGSPYKTSHGTSVYISPKDESIYHGENLPVPQVRISDHSGGWGERRGPIKPIGFDLATPKTEEEIQAAITNVINSGKAFYDIPGVKSDLAEATELAIKNSKIINQKKALDAYEKNIKNGSKNNRKSAIAQARIYDKDFVPPLHSEDLATKYELPPVITGAEREVNLAKFLEGSQAPRDLYTGTSKDKDFEQFNVPKSGTWFTTDPESASAYSLENDSMTARRIPGSFNFEDVNSASRVLPVHLRAKNPYRITDTQEFNKQLYALGGDNYKKAQGILFDKLREAGHDSVVLGTDPAEQVWVSLEGPNQMKSRFNRGTFDPKEKAMSKARGGLVRKYKVR